MSYRATSNFIPAISICVFQILDIILNIHILGEYLTNSLLTRNVSVGARMTRQTTFNEMG